MSLYYDAVSVLTVTDQQGSLKSRIYSNKSGLKSKPAHLYALISECAKYDVFLKEVIENSQIIEREPKVTPLLSLLLLHDHFFAKGGVAASSKHPLKQAVERHKARLQAEFTKARLRRRCGTIDDLKIVLAADKSGVLSATGPQVRWVRVNALKSSVSVQLQSTFAGYDRASNLKHVASRTAAERSHIPDQHIPDLVAVPPGANLVKSQAYIDGELILQDKASCFPAYLLLGDTDQQIGDVMDSCAAPGNKTTHLAAILASSHAKQNRRIFACERDPRRSGILTDMVKKAGASNVQVLAKQDFLALDPNDEQFANVTHLLLDPSCSGSGILGREDIPQLSLPADPRTKAPQTKDQPPFKKRKHNSIADDEQERNDDEEKEEEEQPNASAKKDPERLAKLANLQSRIVEHALTFPAARRITYSTCSIHAEENEAVVSRVLASDVAKRRGWRVLRRQEQPVGMRGWPHRGRLPLEFSGDAEDSKGSVDLLSQDDLEGCVRCYPNDEQAAMGFFVVCFVRDEGDDGELLQKKKKTEKDGLGRRGTTTTGPVKHAVSDKDEWAGFSD